MQVRRIFKAANPYLGALGVLLLIAALLVTMFFTWLSIQWITFLAGILMAAILALVSRSARAEWIIARRTAQLTVMREKLGKETLRRTVVEEALTTVKTNVHYIDQIMPAMLVYVDAEQLYRYHNRAFRDLVGIRREHIDNHHVRHVLGEQVYAEIEKNIRLALTGTPVQFERVHKFADGTTIRLSVQYLPHFGEQGKVLGFFELLVNSTNMQALSAPKTEAPPLLASVPVNNIEQEMYVDAIAEQLTGWRNVADRLRSALDQNEFFLYYQSIMPAAASGAGMPFYEILLRLGEEEQNMMPPGAFLPLAEEHGLLPDLDRWVVRNLLKWVDSNPNRHNAVYSVNISGQTISDPEFPEYVREQLRTAKSTKAILCFEFAATEAIARPADTNRFIREMKQNNCQLALSGFGRNPVSFNLLNQLPIDYIKIDGSLILNILRDPVDLVKVRAINRVAHAIRMRTIAEFVESEEILAKLREVEVDFAQGFGISVPRPLTELDMPFEEPRLVAVKS